MKVIFNVDAITAPLTGIGRYALELAHGLARHEDIEELRLYSAVRWVDDPTEALSSNRMFASLRKQSCRSRRTHWKRIRGCAMCCFARTREI